MISRSTEAATRSPATNEGTWFDVGLGFSKALSETSYVYLDVETSLGNDFEDTYQINAGLQWSFS